MNRCVAVKMEGNVSGDRECRGAKAMLLIRNGGFEGMSYEITAEETLIGRNPTTDITLLDEGISREHALIVYDPDDDTYTIEDLQSTNGTKVNGKRVRSSQLRDGDDLQIGHTHFQFLLSTSDED
jgi:pSer/pThr/pTyr-binding forkhead associated (FHA) protein